MKNTFQGYYQPTEDEFSQLWNDSVLVFDANILLNIYRYSKDTRETLIDIFSKFSERLWVPHQAASEYQKRRLKVIGDQEFAYKNIRDSLKKQQIQIEKDLNTYKMHPFIKVADILEKIDANFKEIVIELDLLEQNHPDLIDNDELRDRITELFDGKVGPSCSPEELENIYKTGKKRYARDIPPGFEDIKKDKNKDEDGVSRYGDLVLWFQLINHAKSIKKPIIFITDDSKEDWWLKFNGKTIGPRPELINEISTTASVNFYMYKADRFIKYAQEYLGEQVNNKAIKEIQEIKRLDEKKVKDFIIRLKKVNEIKEHQKHIARLIKQRRLGLSAEDCPDYEDCGDCPDYEDCGDCPDYEDCGDCPDYEDCGDCPD